MRHPSRGNRRGAAPPALVRDIDWILLDHGIDLPKADIKAVLAWLLSGSYGDTIGGPTSPQSHLSDGAESESCHQSQELKPIDTAQHRTLMSRRMTSSNSDLAAGSLMGTAMGTRDVAK